MGRGRGGSARPAVGTLDDVARAVAAARARDAYALAPDDPSARLLYLATMLEQAAYENGLDRPLDEKSPAAVEAGRFGVKPIEETLKYAMACNRPAAAAAAARLLGQIGTADQLLYQGDRPGAAGVGRAIARPPRAHGRSAGRSCGCNRPGPSPGRATCCRRSASLPAAAARAMRWSPLRA